MSGGFDGVLRFSCAARYAAAIQGGWASRPPEFKIGTRMELCSMRCGVLLLL